MTGHYVPTDFFETSAMIITLILLGKYLECAAKGKTSEAITKVCGARRGYAAQWKSSESLSC